MGSSQISFEVFIQERGTRRDQVGAVSKVIEVLFNLLQYSSTVFSKKDLMNTKALTKSIIKSVEALGNVRKMLDAHCRCKLLDKRSAV